MTRRPYQIEALGCILDKLARYRSTLAVLPTGTGKTVLFADVLAAFKPRGRGLVIAHREELITQACEKIRDFTSLTTDVEMGESKVSSLFASDVVVASVQTLASAARRGKFRPEEFAIIVIDEAHHAVASTYGSVINYFTGAKILGVTATPDRLDGAAMRKVFESAAYVYEIRDAIEQGFLVPIRQKYLEVDSLDLSTVKQNKKTGDYSDEDLERAMLDERVLHEIAAPLVQHAGDRQSLVFCPGVAHAKALAEVIDRYKPRSAVAVDGALSTDERRARIAAFHRGDVQFLCNCALLTEGFDAPPTSLVAVARPTQSRSLYAQMIGRGTRIHPGKRDLLALDFVGNSAKHKLVSVADILDGNTNAAVRERTMKVSRENPEMDVLSALKMADEMIAAEGRAAKLTARATFRAVDVDPFEVLGASDRTGRFGGLPATERQIDMLTRAGVDAVPLDKGQADALIERIVQRGKSGLCTFKQARILASRGLNPDAGIKDASEAIGAIIANGWKVPAWLLNDPRFAVKATG